MVTTWLRETYCGLHGHDSLLQFEQERMFLKCVSCGHESPGWELTETPPTARPNTEGRQLTQLQPLTDSQRAA